MAITLVASAVGTNNGNYTTFSLAKADLSGLTNGDLVIIHYSFDVDLAATIIATGFTKVDELLTDVGRDLTSGYFYKFMIDVAGEPATWAFGTDQSSEKCGVATAWRGVANPGYLDVAATTATAVNDATPDGLDITTGVDGAMIVSSCHLAETGTGGYTGVAPTELTLANETDSVGNDETLCAVAYLEKSTLGAQSIGVWANTPDDAAAESHTRTISLEPASLETPEIDEFEEVTVAENVEGVLSAVIVETEFDEVTIVEDVDVEVAAQPDLDIDEFDTITLEEHIESVESDLSIDEFEGVTVDEYVEGIHSDIVLDPYEEVTVEEDVTVEVIAQPDLTIDRFEEVSLTEDIESTGSDLVVDEFDSITTGEDTTVEVIAQADLSIDEFESVTLLEDITAALAHEFILSLSDNFADGAATTVQLEAPATKDTGDFQAGKIHESSNPADAIDLAADLYTEVEFCFETTIDTGEVSYDFRIEGLDTYTVTPQLTVIAGGGTLEVNVHDCADAITCLV